MKKRRIMSAVLALIMLAGLLPTGALIPAARAVTPGSTPVKQWVETATVKAMRLYPFTLDVNFVRTNTDKLDLLGEMGRVTTTGGYETLVQVDGGTVYHPSNVIADGLRLDLDLEPVGDHYIKVLYTLRNSGSVSHTVNLGSCAHILLGINPFAPIWATEPGGKTLYMHEGILDHYALKIIATQCDHVWYGPHPNEDIFMFKGMDDRGPDNVYRFDGAVSWSWTDVVVPPGTSWQSYVLIGGGELGTMEKVPDPVVAPPVLPVPPDPSITLKQADYYLTEGEALPNWNDLVAAYVGTVSVSGQPANSNTYGEHTVTYTAAKNGKTATARLKVHILPLPAQLSQTTASGSKDFTLTAKLTRTGGLTFTETGFVYGASQNPSMTVKDGQVKTAAAVNSKGGTLSAKVTGLEDGVKYYARAYAKASDGTVLYGPQSAAFGPGVPNFGTFHVKHKGGGTFTVYRDGGSAGVQKVYYRTVNGSAVGSMNDDQHHFRHTDGVLTFNAGEDSKDVTVTEHGANAEYSGVATKYSNADRTYQMEINRVEGGAIIGTRFATRNMGHSGSYTVDRNVYTTEHSGGQVSPSSSVYWVADHSGGDAADIWFVNDRGKNSGTDANYSFTYKPTYNEYLQNTITGWLYRYSITAHETENGYEHVWVGNQAPSSNGSKDNKVAGGGNAIPLNSSLGTALFTGSFEMWENKDLTVKVPQVGCGVVDACDGRLRNANGTGNMKTVGSDSYLVMGKDDTAYCYFSANGSGKEFWYIRNHTSYDLPLDTTEPHLIDVAYMARNASTTTYLPGDPITVSLIFDEIVDQNNSAAAGLKVDESFVTLQGWDVPFYYKGGAGTNVLYFTAITPEDAPTGQSNLKVSNVNCAGQIRDMAGNACTGGTASSTAPVSSRAKPTVTVGDITNSSGTLTATVNSTDAEKLEYVWTTTPAAEGKAPAYGWKLIPANAPYDAVTRQGAGTWYLYARATNADGRTAIGKKSYTIPSSGSGALVVPSLAVSANNSAWAQARAITVTKTPSNATVTCTAKPSGATVTPSGGNFIVDRNGSYTFKLTSGSETASAIVTVSKLDLTPPAIAINELTNRSHTAPVTLTFSVADGESGVGSVSAKWNGTAAALKNNGDGTYTTTSPDDGANSAWTLTVTATDKLGNSGTKSSATYTVNDKAPTLTVTKKSESNRGWVYNYSVNANGNTGVTVSLPDGTPTEVLSGTFTLTAPGDHIVVVNDDAGHFVSWTTNVPTPSTGVLDGDPPEVQLYPDKWEWTRQDITVGVGVYEENGTPTAKRDNNAALALTQNAMGAGHYQGSFTVSENGTYAVAVTDANGNVGTGSITIPNIDKTGPAIGEPTGNPAAWTKDSAAIQFSVDDAQSGLKTVTVKKGETNVPVTNTSGNCSFTAAENGDYVITATDAVGNASTKTVTVEKIDKTEPTLAVSGGTTAAASLELSVAAANSGGSGVTATVSKDGGAAETVADGTYTINAAGAYTFTATTGTGLTKSQTVSVYGVAFAETGDSTVPGQIVVSGGKVAAPTVSKTGYTLSGWKNGAVDWNFDSSTVTADTTLTAQWTITPAQAPAVTGPADAEVTYGYETAPTLSVSATAGAGDAETLAYQWYSNTTASATGGTVLDGATESSYTVPTGLGAGSYYYYCVVTATRKDNGQTATAASGVATVTVDKAASTVTAPTANTLTYNGSAQELVAAGSSPDGVIEYSLDGTTYSTAVPTATNAGSYTVYYKEKGDANHADTEPGTVPVTIAPVVLTPSVASVEGKIYDGKTDTTGTIALEGAVNGETPTATGTFAFETADAGEGKTVKVTNITLDNGVGVNYALSAEELTTTAAIAPKDVSAATVTLGEGLTYNGAEQTQTIQSVVVDGLSVTYTVTGDKQTNAGDYTLTVTGDGNFTGSVSKDFSIARKPITGAVTIAGKAFVEQALTAEYATEGAGETVAYQWYRDGVAIDGATGGTYTVVPDDLGKAITVTVNGTGNYTGDVTSTATDAVGKTLPVVTVWPTAGGVTYGQTLADSALTGGTANVEGTFTWTDDSIQPTVPDSGKTPYSVTFTPNDTNSYSSLTGTVTVTVHKADPTVTAPAANVLTYDGTAQALVAAGTTTGGEMQYSIDGGEYSAAVPTATDAKEYTVSYKVVGGDNYNDVPAVSFTVTIARKQITGTVSIAGTAKMDETLTANYTAAGETVAYQWYRDDAPIGAATGSTYKIGAADVGHTIKVTASGTGNYVGDVTANPTAAVGKTVPTVTWPTAAPITFGQSLGDSELTGGVSSAEGTFTWTDGTVKPALSDSDTTPYGVTFTPADLNSYEIVTGTVTVTVNKADPSLTAPTANSLTYTGAAQELVTAGGSPDGEMRYSTDGVTYSAELPTGTNAGTYTVYYKVVGDENHADTEPVEVPVTVAQVVLTPSVASVEGKVYDGKTGTAGTIGLAGAVNGESPTAAGIFTFETADAGEDKPVNVTGITLDDGWGVNYALSTEELTAAATITPKDISAATVTLGEGLTYTGYEQTQEVSKVEIGGLEATYGVTDNTGTDAKAYALTVTGNGNFTGSITVDFSIAKAGNRISGFSCGDIIYGEAPKPTAEAEFGEIEYAYSHSEDGGFAPWSGGGQTGTWYVKASVADTDNYAGAEAVTSFREAAQRETKPDAGIDYLAETLTGLAAGADHIITPAGGTVVTVKADENGVVEIQEDWFGKDLSIVTKARSEDWSDSFPQDLAVPTRPAAPAVQGENETVDGEHDGRMTGLDDGTDYQISSDGGVSWTDAAVAEGGISGLAPETYQVRLKATEASFAGVPATVTIATGEARTYTLNLAVPAFDAVAEGYDQPEAKAITITSAGNSDSAVYSVEADAAIFTIGGGGDTVPAGGRVDTWTIRPNAGLAPGVYASEVTVTYNDNATVKAQVSFTVNEATPDIRIDYAAETLTGFEDGETYTIGGVEVTPEAGTLPAREYMGKTLSIVKKGDGTGTDSVPQELEVPARPAAPTGPQVSGETIQGKTDGKITGIDGTMEYKPGDGDWRGGPADLENLPAGTAVTVRSKASSHAFASEQRTLTVGAGRPITVTFDAQGGSPVPPALTGLFYLDRAVEPTVVPAKEGFTFCGWYTEPGCVNRWNFARELADSLTLYAKWAETTCSISGVVDDNGDPVEGATVKLVQGKVILQTVTTDSDGQYRFDGVVPGDYNVVAAKGDKTMTILVTIVDESAERQNLTMPADKVNSILEVKGDATPDVVVGGLDEEAKANKKSGSTVTVTMTVEEKAEGDAAHAAEIKAQAGANAGLEYLEIGVKKTVETDGSTLETPITDTQELMEIIIPFDFTGKINVRAYRYHASQVDTITQAPNADREKIVLGPDRVTLYVKKFSTYAIGYTSVASAHTVTVQNDGHGTAGADPASAAEGEEITLTASPRGGYRFKEWQVVEGSVSVSDNKFTMPDEDVTVKAIFEYVGGSSGGRVTPSKPTIQQPEHGTVTISPTDPKPGGKVIVTVAPEDGYEVDEVIITDQDGKTVEVTRAPDGTYTYTQPKGKVTISADLKKSDSTAYTVCPKDDTCPIWPYEDASVTAWYHDGVHYCIENGLMTGYGNNKFGPNDTLTRGMLAQILYNKEDRPVVSAGSPFDDVTGDAWYAKAVIWGARNGVLKGYGNGKFGPEDPITREQLAVMLWRYAGSPESGETLARFTDGGKTSSWAAAALRWAAEQGIVTGKGGGVLDPTGTATRAEAAAMLQRYLQTAEQ